MFINMVIIPFLRDDFFMLNLVELISWHVQITHFFWFLDFFACYD